MGLGLGGWRCTADAVSTHMCIVAAVGIEKALWWSGSNMTSPDASAKLCFNGFTVWQQHTHCTGAVSRWTRLQAKLSRYSQCSTLVTGGSTASTIACRVSVSTVGTHGGVQVCNAINWACCQADVQHCRHAAAARTACSCHQPMTSG